MLVAIFSGAFVGAFIAVAVLGHVLLLDAILSTPAESEAPASRSPDSLRATAGTFG